MILNKYLKRAVDLFDEEKRGCDKEKSNLRTALTKLKSRRDALQARLSEQQSDHGRKSIEREMKVIDAQQRKALKMLESLETNAHQDVDGSERTSHDITGRGAMA